jgi:predicted CXXCH cytochrome family protein
MPLVARVYRPQLLAPLLLLLLLAAWATADWYRGLPRDAMRHATYVGRERCVTCHQQEAAAWTGSHHDRAMEIASEASVLGDFDNAEFDRLGVHTRFFRDGDRYLVNTEGPDGQNHDYEIAYTFGVEPLQQYMVKFPDGRVQVLRVSWDTRRKQWFYVAPPDEEDVRIEPDEPLHWTGLGQNWNTMCAECHSTDYHKNYDLATDTYDSTFREIDVSCEMCHGPGSVHVALAEGNGLFWDRHHGYGLTNRLKGGTNNRQIETCAPCHSRRGGIHENYRAGDSYFDHFEPMLLHDGLYHANGAILDEVYVYGSFVQSKMYQKDVRCTDCHNPHSLQLKFPGNQLCAQCHQPGIYDTAGHHHHTDEAATQCVNCHMPSRVYMGIDDRRDHSLRVPRPDLSATLGTPNACNDCHTKEGEDAAWAADWVRRWYGDKRPDDPHFASALQAARRTAPEGESLLLEAVARATTPDIVRATAIELLNQYPSGASLEVRREALDHINPLVRGAAIRAMPIPPSQEEIAASERAGGTGDNPLRQTRAQFINDLAPRLKDGARSVRVAAASRIVAAANELANSAFRGDLEQAISEFRAAQTMHLDRAGSHLNLANLSLQLASAAAQRGDLRAQKQHLREAVESLRAAIQRESYLSGSRGELARLLEEISTDPNLREIAPSAGANPSEIERLRREEVVLLERDGQLLRDAPRPHYQRGMLLYLLHEHTAARQALLEACRLGPNDYNNWLALALICEQQQRWQETVAALERMLQLRPGDPVAQQIYVRLRATLESKGVEVRKARE